MAPDRALLGAIMRAVGPEDVDEHTVPAPSPSAYAVEVDGEAVLLDEGRNRLHSLNSTGALVWACFDGTSTIAEIATDLGNELGVPRDVVLADTLALARRLGAEGLLANVEPSPDALGGDDESQEAVVEGDDDCAEEDDEAVPPPASGDDDPRFVTEPPNP